MQVFNIKEESLKLSNSCIKKFKYYNNFHLYQLYRKSESASRTWTKVIGNASAGSPTRQLSTTLPCHPRFSPV